MMSNRRLSIRYLGVIGAAAFILASAAASADDVIDDAQDTAHEHPFITASTAATTGVLLSREIDDDNFARARAFTESRYLAIRRDAATGSGENLTTLAILLDESDPRAFGLWMQHNYALLFDGSGDNRQALVTDIVAMR